MRLIMLKASKIVLIIAGMLLIIDAMLMAAGIPNPFLGWPLPSPVALVNEQDFWL
jgi:hypothetical protein